MSSSQNKHGSKTGNREERRRGRGHLAVWIISGGFVLVGLAILSGGMWVKVKAGLAQVLLERAFEQPEEASARPWPWADIEPVARLAAPQLGKSSIVLSGVSGEALAFGPGHLPGTALPGERGTVVYSAHRDTHFSWIGDLRPGDVVEVETREGDRVSYSMRRFWVAPWDSPGIDASSDEHLIALTTCWPLDATGPTRLRYVAEGVRLPDATEAAASAPQDPNNGI